VTIYPYSSTHRIEEVGRDVLRKDLSPASLLGPVSIRPTLMEDPTREPAVYRNVLTPLGIGPRCLASGDDWVVLERVVAPELWQIGELSVWVDVGRWLAGLHRLLAAARTRDVPLVLYDASLYASFRERAARAGSPRVVLAAHERGTGRLLGLPSVCLHGDLYPSNLLVETGPPLKVWPVDWELMGWGPAAIDLAALVAGWAPSAREAITRAYCETEEHPWSSILWSEALDAARLHLCVQWLGAPAGWVPPQAHRHDWMAEALELAERV
jgi:Phosphotransferase enzyme family